MNDVLQSLSPAALRAVMGPQISPVVLHRLLGPLASTGSLAALLTASPLVAAAMVLARDAGREAYCPVPPPSVRKVDLRRWTDAVLDAAEALSGVAVDRVACVEKAEEVFDRRSDS